MKITEAKHYAIIKSLIMSMGRGGRVGGCFGLVHDCTDINRSLFWPTTITAVGIVSYSSPSLSISKRVLCSTK